MEENDIISTTEPTDSSLQEPPTGMDAAKPDGSDDGTPAQAAPTVDQADPMKILDSLQGIDDATKKMLRDGYLRHSDYTRKTQELATQRKEVESLVAVKPYIDRVLQNPELARQVFGDAFKPTDMPAAPVNQDIPEDPKEFADWVISQAVDKAQAQIVQQMQEERDIAEAEKLDPRLATDEDFARTIAGYMSQDQEFVQGKKGYTQATKEALTRYNRMVDGLRKTFKDEMTKRATDSRKFASPKNDSPASTVATGKPLTMREAAKMAEEQLAR